MSLSDLAALGSFISGFAVLVSLVFLYFQLRQVNAQVLQTEKNQRALMQQGRANRISENCMFIAQPGLSSLYHRGLSGDETLTAEQLEQFMLIIRGALISAEDSFLQNHAGLLDPVAFDSFAAGARIFFTRPGLRAAWQLSSGQFGDEFAQFMNDLMNETETAPETDRLAQWVTMVKAQNARRGDA